MMKIMIKVYFLIYVNVGVGVTEKKTAKRVTLRCYYR